MNTSVQVFADGTRMDAWGINLSDLGMGLFTIANLPLESTIEVEFRAPEETERVRLSAVVRHRALYLYGVEFLPDRSPHTQSEVESSPRHQAVGH